ncbi:hypothetical protein TSOC_009654 [Tetrabaena socialis]|uniref:Uncharacterized protein n=1 Tax=Tetrabaena socialis TaxID=47790 RepID=A0A2J7ZVC4_9CHLO|nr:hypothetical protein TSOC_009654 [Tetrabaena socialis]|eukprot:PNH04210.1 hypothetical protein TSOC_009654 [Tetrabaena socialis]
MSSFVLVLVGVPGSGKSFLSRRLEMRGWARINQDELGSRRACEDAYCSALQLRRHVVVDRCNFDVTQRSHWVRLAHAARSPSGVVLVALQLLVPLPLCKERARARTDHPTLGPHNCDEVIGRFASDFVPASQREGFHRVLTARSSQEAEAAAEQLAAEAAGGGGGAGPAAVTHAPAGAYGLQAPHHLLVAEYCHPHQPHPAPQHQHQHPSLAPQQQQQQVHPAQVGQYQHQHPRQQQHHQQQHLHQPQQQQVDGPYQEYGHVPLQHQPPYHQQHHYQQHQQHQHLEPPSTAPAPSQPPQPSVALLAIATDAASRAAAHALGPPAYAWQGTGAEAPAAAPPLQPWLAGQADAAQAQGVHGRGHGGQARLEGQRGGSAARGSGSQHQAVVEQLRGMFADPRLGIYTSSTVRTAQHALELLEAAAGAGGGGEEQQPLFERRLVLHREHTTPAPKGHVDGGGDPWDTLKPLGRWFGSLGRVVLVDDDAYKSIPGEEPNMLQVPVWRDEHTACPVLRLLTELLLEVAAPLPQDADVRAWTSQVAARLGAAVAATAPAPPPALAPTC